MSLNIKFLSHEDARILNILQVQSSDFIIQVGRSYRNSLADDLLVKIDCHVIRFSPMKSGGNGCNQIAMSSVP
jgi:hypothetical protein